ncbi:hypothetical protein EI533_32700, partial [Pseudomonas donghuensis]|nr:hypothetical protein [Pseudomonas donghuensis]
DRECTPFSVSDIFCRRVCLSLDNSWRITADMRPEILTIAPTDPIFSTNISVIFQQKEGESLTYDTPSLS